MDTIKESLAQGRKVRIGILGCASVVKKRAISAFKSLPNGIVTCIASRDLQKARQWAEELEIPLACSYEELVQRNDVDAVYIPLPIGLHEEWIVRAAAQKKHIMCEKSLTHSFAAAQRAVSACQRHGVVLFENFMCDYHPQHKVVRDSFSRLGELRVLRGYFGFPPLDKNSFRYNLQLGGGSLNDAGAYTLFMARRLLQEEPQAVCCVLMIDQQTKVDTSGTALVIFPSGTSALLAFGFDNVYQNLYEIWGQKGVLTVNPAYSIPDITPPHIQLLTNENLNTKIEKLEAPFADQFSLIFADFCKVILEKDNTARQRKYSDILLQAKMMEALRISAREGRMVYLKELGKGFESRKDEVYSHG